MIFRSSEICLIFNILVFTNVALVDRKCLPELHLAKWKIIPDDILKKSAYIAAAIDTHRQRNLQRAQFATYFNG